MKPAVANTELRHPVFGGSSLLRKSVLGALAISSVTLLSPWAATAADYKLKIPFGLEASCRRHSCRQSVDDGEGRVRPGTVL